MVKCTEHTKDPQLSIFLVEMAHDDDDIIYLNRYKSRPSVIWSTSKSMIYIHRYEFKQSMRRWNTSSAIKVEGSTTIKADRISNINGHKFSVYSFSSICEVYTTSWWIPAKLVGWRKDHNQSRRKTIADPPHIYAFNNLKNDYYLNIFFLKNNLRHHSSQS